MDKYNDFITEKLRIKEIGEAEPILKTMLNEEEYKIIDSIVFQNKSIAYTGRILGYSTNQIRSRFFKILRKIGHTKSLR